jgi:hypothetical protein
MKSNLTIIKENIKNHRKLVSFKKDAIAYCIDCLDMGKKVDKTILTYLSLKNNQHKLILTALNNMSNISEIAKFRANKKTIILENVNNILGAISIDCLKENKINKQHIKALEKNLDSSIKLDKKRNPIIRFLFKKSDATNAIEKIIKSTKKSVQIYAYEIKNPIDNLQTYNTYAKK